MRVFGACVSVVDANGIALLSTVCVRHTPAAYSMWSSCDEQLNGLAAAKGEWRDGGAYREQ